MSKYFKFMSGALAVVLCFAAMAFGQRTSGNIEGTVTDPNGAVVPNATVTARSTGTTAGYNQTITSDANGVFQFSQVPVGTYEVTATGTGFSTSRQQVTVVADRSAPANFQLTVGQAGVVVDVVADSSVTIDPTDTKIDTNITKQVFDALPKGTQFTSILKAAPNVRQEALSGGFQIDGASGSENVFVIDGQEVTNFRTGTLNTNNNLPFELLQEVQVKSTGLEAEYGGATGGVVNVVTVGGNDEWRGNFAISFRPGKLQGDPRIIVNQFNTNAGGFENFIPRKDGGTSYFPVATLSGPVVKGKLWFTAAYAPQITETNRVIDYYSNPNPAARSITQSIAYDQKLKQEYAFARLDAQPYSKLRVFGSFLWNPLVQTGVLPALTEGLGGAPQSANFGGSIGTYTGADLLNRQGGRQNANNLNGQATWNPTNWLVLNFRGGRSFLNEKLNSYFIPRITQYICSATNNGIPAGAGCNSGFFNIANNFQIDYDVSTRTTFDADASIVGVNLGGRHTFKFGYQFNRLFNTTNQGYIDTGVITLYYNRPINAQVSSLVPTGSTVANPSGRCDSATYVPGDPCNVGSGRIQRFGTSGEASSNNIALFAQDTWQIANRLTLNLGIRAENETVPSFGPEATSESITFGWGDKISPRVGVAFDVFGNGKTKIFGNYGWFYDRFKYELPRGSFGGDFYRRDYFEILPSRGIPYTSYTYANILGGRADELGGTCPISPTVGYSRCQFDFRIATNIVGADLFDSGAVDPDLKAARQSEYTVGLEHQLWNNFLLAARYTHKQVDHAIEDIGLYNANGSEAYIIGNPGEGLHCEVQDSFNQPCPKAERIYDAFEIRADKRASNYFFSASYTLSRLYGNYSGLASSDENGRTSPGVNRFFDLPPLGFNANGEPDNGRLATDRPHVFKAFGGYSWNWSSSNRTTVSGFTTIQSGTPLTTIYDLYQLGTTILFGRGDLGRTETFTETDLSVSHRYKFGRDNRFTLEPFVDIRNLFDEKNAIRYQTSISSVIFAGGGATANLRVGGCATCTGEGATFDTIFNGAGIQQAVVNYLNSQPVSATGRRNDYGVANGFQGARDVRFGARFFF